MTPTYKPIHPINSQTDRDGKGIPFAESAPNSRDSCEAGRAVGVVARVTLHGIRPRSTRAFHFDAGQGKHRIAVEMRLSLRPFAKLATAMLLFAAVALPSRSASADVLGDVKRLNSHLDPDNPLALALKVHGLSQSPSDFFRGTADLFYDWCETHGADWRDDTSDFVLMHGDLHPGNIGTLRSPGESDAVHFSLVDLDEVFRGSFKPDLLRALTSLRFAADEAGLSPTKENWAKWSRSLCSAYAHAIMNPPSDAELASQYKIVKKLIKKAAEENAEAYTARFIVPGLRPAFRGAAEKKGKPSDLMTPPDEKTLKQIRSALASTYFGGENGSRRRAALGYDSEERLRDAILDVVNWTSLSSGGSQGLRKYLVLLRHAGASNNDGLLILQLKEEPKPAAERAGYVKHDNSIDRGEFVARAHETLQCHPSLWIGSIRLGDRSFLVKPKSPFAKEPSQKNLNKPGEFEEMARLMGALLGRAHAASLSDQQKRAGKIAESARTFDTTLDRLSGKAHRAFKSMFKELQNDPAAHELSVKAQNAIREHIDQQRPVHTER